MSWTKMSKLRLVLQFKLILMQFPGISEQSVGTPVDDLKPRQEAETETQSQESAHLEELLCSHQHGNY